MLKFKTIILSTTASLLVFGAPAAMAQDATSEARSAPLSLRAMPMREAIAAIAAHYGVKIVSGGPDLDRYRSARVQDAPSVPSAIRQALAGTGLSWRSDNTGRSFGIVVAQGNDDIVVTATRDQAETDLNVNSANSSTRTGKSLREQPRNTQVVTAKLIQDQQDQSVVEALRNVSGASAFASPQGTPAFSIRGFGATALVNGLNSGVGNQPVALLERVEVLKGPDAILAGADNLGGVVNIVTKRPVAQPLLDVSLEAGSFDDYKVTVDGSTALDPDRRFSARLIAEAAHANRNYQGYDGREEYLIAPSLRFKDADTDIVIGGSGSKTFSPLSPYTLFDTNTPGSPLFAQGRTPLGPRHQGAAGESYRAYYDVTHKVADWLTLVSRGEYADFSLKLDPYAAGFLFNAPSTYLFFTTSSDRRSNGLANDNYARFIFKTGPVHHTLTAGFNFSKETDETYTRDPAASSPYYLIDVTTGRGQLFPSGAVYNRPEDFPTTMPATFDQYRELADQLGFYIQDFVEIGPLKLIGAVRRNRYINGIAFVDPAQQVYNDREVKWSTLPSFGAVLNLTKTISIYGNYLRGYSPGFANPYPNSGIPGAFDGPILPDIKSTNLEAGVKVDLFAGKLSLVGSVYRIRQSNITRTDFSGALPAVFVIDGQESKGVEFNANGQILPGWNIAASFSRADYTYLNPTAFLARIMSQPKTKYSLYSSYDFRNGPLKGLGGSAGIYGNSSSSASTSPIASLPNGIPTTPESRQVDLNLRYAFKSFTINAGVKNVFNRLNYVPAPSLNYVPLSEPRTWRVTLSYSFF